jgi:hypothetical protein
VVGRFPIRGLITSHVLCSVSGVVSVNANSKINGASIGVLVILLLAFIGWQWWASQNPRLPRGWPPGSIWMREPGRRLSFGPRGVWIGCWFDTQQGADRCRFADYKGRIIHQSDYETCTEQPPVPNERLWLTAGSYYFIYLRDGTLLVEVNACRTSNGVPRPE